MSVILENEPIAEKPGKVSRSAVRAYRESVFSGNCDEAVLFAARRIRPEWEADKRVYEARVQACETLKVGVAKLEAIAAEVAAAVTEAVSFAASPLPDSMTIGDLRQRVHAANDKVRVDTAVELGAGVLFLANGMPDGHIGRLKSQALRSQSAIADARTRAQQTLYQTAADAGPDHTTEALQRQIEELRRRIAARRPALEAEQLIDEQKAKCETIARGDVCQPSTPMQLTAEGKAEWVKRAYRAARQRLDELMDLVAMKPNAIRDNERDTAELAKLQDKLQVATEAHRRKMCELENMRWVE